MSNGILRCSNCGTLPKQHTNKETKKYLIKCPECKMKTKEYDDFTIAWKEWNRTHINGKNSGGE